MLSTVPSIIPSTSGKYRNGKMPKDSRMALFKGWERHLNPLAMKAYDEYYKLLATLLAFSSLRIILYEKINRT